MSSLSSRSRQKARKKLKTATNFLLYASKSSQIRRKDYEQIFRVYTNNNNILYELRFTTLSTTLPISQRINFHTQSITDRAHKDKRVRATTAKPTTRSFFRVRVIAGAEGPSQNWLSEAKKENLSIFPFFFYPNPTSRWGEAFPLLSPSALMNQTMGPLLASTTFAPCIASLTWT